MKSIPTLKFLPITGVLLLAGTFGVQAANILKSDTTTMNAAADWGGTAPASGSVGEFGSTPTAAHLAAMTLGGSISLSGLQFDSTMQGPLTIASGNTLTLTPATSTLVMQAGSPNVTINCAMAEANNSSTWTVTSAGATLTVPSPGFGTATWTFAGAGNFNFYPGSIQTGNGNGVVTITTTGNFNANDISIGKGSSTTTTVPTATSPVTGSSGGGFGVTGSGSVVTLSTLELNNTQNGGCSGLISAGAVTVTNSVLLGNSSSGSRGCYFQVSGGSFTGATNTGTQMTIAENKSGVQNTAEFYVSGGSATVGSIVFGAAADTVANNAWLIVDGSAANLFVGSGGISKATTVAGSANVALTQGYLLAIANWSSSLPMQLAGTAAPFNIVAGNAVSGGTPYNISLSGVLSGAGSIDKIGGGTLTLSGANTYTGTNILQAGIVNLGVAEGSGNGPLGNPATPAGSIYFSGGTLEYSALNQHDYSSRFSTAANQPISIDTAGQSITFATALTSSGGTLTMTNSTGSGQLTLSAANTYSGSTTNNGGTLVVNGSIAGNVVVNAGGLLGGSGTVNGSATINSGGGLAPGNGVGTLTVGSLTLNAGSTNNFEFNSAPANDLVIVTASGGLVLNGGVFNLYQAGGTTAWNIPNTYNLIQFTGTAPTLDSTWTTVSSTNPHIGNPQTGYKYSFAISGNDLQLTIASSVNNGSWGVNSDGNWSAAGNWSAVAGTMPPRSASDTATFGTGTSLRTVTLDASESVGTVNFNNANSFVIANAGNTLTLDNSGSGASVNVTAGTANSVATGVSLNDNAAVTVSSGQYLSVSGAIGSTSTAFTLAVNGAGTLALSGNNNYGPSASGTTGTTLSGGGTLQLGGSTALGAGDLSVSGNSVIQAGAALSVANNIKVASGVTAWVDNSAANSLTLSGVISGSGAITKTSNGILTLSGANTYAGSTTISNGTVSISNDGASSGNSGNLGIVPASASANNIVLSGGDLLGNTTLALNANRGVNLTGTGLIDAAGSQTLTVNGVISGNNLTLNSQPASSGTIILGGANTYTGNTVISNGLLQLANSLALQDSSLNYNNQGGALSFGTLTSATFGNLAGAQNLALTNNSGAAVALTAGNANNSTYSGVLSGGGSLTKSGSGTLTLTGANTYAGATTVNAGILEITNNGVINGGALNGQGYLVDGGMVTATGSTSLGAANNALDETAGTVTLGSVSQPISAGDGQLIAVSGGTFSANSLSFERTASLTTAPTATAPQSAPTTAGLYVNGGTVNLGALSVSLENSSASVRMDSGVLTVTNEVLLGNMANNRWTVLQNNGGTFTSLDTNMGIVLSQNNGTTANNSELYLSGGGTNTANKISFGVTTDTVGGTGWLIMTNSTLYLGSGGIVLSNTSGSYSANISLLSGILGATTNWSCALPIQLSATNVTVQAADSSGNGHNITLSSVLSGVGPLIKTGSGTLTLSGTNTYTGTTTVSNGTLLVSGSLGTGAVTVESGATIGGNGTNGGSLTLNSGAAVTNNEGSPLTVLGALVLNNNTMDVSTPSALGTGIYPLMTYNTTGSSGSFNSIPVISGAGLAPNTVGTIVTSGGTVTLQVAPNLLLTTLALSSSENPSGYKDSVNFTATIQTNSVTAGNPTGTLTFYTNGVIFDTESVSAGSATSVSTTSLPRGTDVIKVVYSGDANYFGSTNSLDQVVTNHPPVARTMTVVRTAGLNALIALSDLATNWSDADGDTVSLTGISLVSTNGVNLTGVNLTQIGGAYVITNNAFLLYTNSQNVNDQFTYSINDGFGGTNLGLVNLIINASPITGYPAGMSVSGASATVNFAGIPGYSYNIQRSTNLTDWVTLWTTNAPGNGLFNFTDSFGDLGGPPASAYYRLEWNH